MEQAGSQGDAPRFLRSADMLYDAIVRDLTATHAGAIAVRTGPTPQVLLVTARAPTEQWVLPKGHISPGETPEDAALRELREETGVEGDLLGVVDDVPFRSRTGPAVVRYYLVRARSEGESREGRRYAWLGYDEAVKRLTFPDARRALAAAWSRLAHEAP